MNCFSKFCDKNALEINISKTEAIYVNCKGDLRINRQEITVVFKFKYLGLVVTNNSSKPETML
jgi:hypothetical protein